jgi:hypothetical protein
VKNAFRVLAVTFVIAATAAMAQSPAAPKPANPFHRFFGEWTLKNDEWTHNWGGGIETIKIPNHHTVIKPLNTENSVLSLVSTPPAGHILWTWNPVKKIVHHQSSFGELRIGTGEGTLDESGNLELKVSFEGEAAGTYRLYTYTWLSKDEYELKSVQYDDKNVATGLFYTGKFIRLKN